MLEMSLPILLSLASGIYGQLFDPLTVLMVLPIGLKPLPKDIESALISAIDDLNRKVSVSQQPITIISFDNLKACIGSTERNVVVVDTMTSEKTEIDVSRGLPLRGYNFLLTVEVDRVACTENMKFLASARPCDVSGGRPLIGKLNICTEQRRWKSFQARTDLFRHEILHALGFGTIVPQNPKAIAPPNEKIPWFDGKSYQKITKFYMDFAKTATEVAKRHFGCDELFGIEADGNNRIHLNEYIFGNELMTPKLSNHFNLFTQISAAILEHTFIGEKPWYKVNSTAIGLEMENYWYGREWGCGFLRTSCFGLVLPLFCSEESLSSGSQTYCVKENGSLNVEVSRCSTTPITRSRNSENGLEASHLALTYNNPRLFGLAGSSDLFNFCPITKSLEDGTIFRFSKAPQICK